jgi:hypothetical protein
MRSIASSARIRISSAVAGGRDVVVGVVRQGVITRQCSISVSRVKESADEIYREIDRKIRSHVEVKRESKDFAEQVSHYWKSISPVRTWSLRGECACRETPGCRWPAAVLGRHPVVVRAFHRIRHR